MRILATGLLAVMLTTAVVAQQKLEVRDLQNHPFNIEFSSGSRLRMHLQAGDFRIRGRDDEKILIHFEGKNAGKASNLTVRLTRSDHSGDLYIFGGPKKDLQVTVEIPRVTDITIRMRGGDLDVSRILGDQDVKLIGGDLTIGVGKPQEYALVDASVRFGDVHGDAFGDPKGWLGGALRMEGAGKYKLRAHVLAGDLTLVSSIEEQDAIGEWAGELSLEKDWQLLQLHVDSAQGAIKGILDVPLQGATGIELKNLRWKAPGVAFEAATPFGEMDFSGELRNGELLGSVKDSKSGVETGSFRLAHLAKINASAYAGGYDAGAGRLITISTWPEQSIDLTRLLLQYTDAQTGEFGSLFPVSDTKFVSGGPLARIFPIELEVMFERNPQGEITGLTWHEGDATEIHANKTAPYREEQVKFRNQDVTLAGTLVIPLSPGRLPAVVFTHGSGPQLRQRGVLEQLLVRRGVAVLTYDKRGMGESTGNWQSASFTDLADDAAAGADFLKTRSDIDPERIGFWGLSQGGWIAPFAASRFGHAGFVVAASGGGLSPDRQELLDTESALRDANFSASEIDEALAFQNAKNTFMRAGSKWEEYQSLQQADKDKKWYGFGSTDAWGPESKDDPYWAATRSFYFYDPAPAIQSLRCPVLFIFGDLDTPKAVQENEANLRSWFESSGNRDAAIKVFPNAGHNLFIGESDYMATLTKQRLRYVPGYLDFVQSWIAQHGGIAK
jgi:uncharacterized protein